MIWLSFMKRILTLGVDALLLRPEMKLLITFLLFLCFQLVGGYTNVHANAHSTIHPPEHTTHPPKQMEWQNVTAHHDYILDYHDDLAWEYAHLMSVEDESEEDFLKKHVLLVKYVVAFYYSFILNSSDNHCPTRLSPSKHLAFLGKSQYIVQRVIKI